MSNDDVKESKFVVIASVVGALMFLGSIIINLDIFDVLYLVCVVVFIIRYIIAVHRNK